MYHTFTIYNTHNKIKNAEHTATLQYTIQHLLLIILYLTNNEA